MVWVFDVPLHAAGSSTVGLLPCHPFVFRFCNIGRRSHVRVRCNGVLELTRGTVMCERRRRSFSALATGTNSFEVMSARALGVFMKQKHASGSGPPSLDGFSRQRRGLIREPTLYILKASSPVPSNTGSHDLYEL